MTLKLILDREPLIEWSKIHGSRQVKNELYSTIVKKLQKGDSVNNMLLFGHPVTGEIHSVHVRRDNGESDCFNFQQEMYYCKSTQNF